MHPSITRSKTAVSLRWRGRSLVFWRNLKDLIQGWVRAGTENSTAREAEPEAFLSWQPKEHPFKLLAKFIGVRLFFIYTHTHNLQTSLFNKKGNHEEHAPLWLYVVHRHRVKWPQATKHNYTYVRGQAAVLKKRLPAHENGCMATKMAAWPRKRMPGHENGYLATA